MEEAKDLLVGIGDKATCLCGLCGRLYAERPLVCLCRSNAFLQDLEEPEVVTEKIIQLSEKMRRRAQ